MADKSQLWAQLGNPINLPLVVNCPAGMTDNPSLIGASTEPTLQVQLDTQSGQHLLLSLNVRAARQVVLGLAAQLQSLGYPLEEESDEPPKGH